MNTIGFKIRKIREQKNFTQEYIAESIGISQNAYSKIENNQVKLSTGRLKAIAQVLDVPEHELFNSDAVIFSNNQIHYTYVNNLFETQKELYEQTITLLKEEITRLSSEKDKLLTIIEKNLLK